MIPDVVLRKAYAFPGDECVAGAPDAEVHFGRVVAERRGFLSGLQHRQLHLYAGSEARRIRFGERVDDQAFAPAVRGQRQVREPLDFRADLAAGDDDWGPVAVRVPRLGPDAVDEATTHVRKIFPELVHYALLARGRDRTP